MKITADRASAGFPIDKNDKPVRTASKTSSGELARRIETEDGLELTGKPAFSAVRESNIDASHSLAGELDTIRQRLAALTGSLLSNPQEALAAQANLDAEKVAGLIG